MKEYSEVSQLRTQIAILESQLDHQTSSLRQQLELQNQINKHLTLDNNRQAMLIRKLSEVESNKEIVTKVEKTYKKKKPDPIGGLGPTENVPGYDG